jgi:hypothetical protein
MSDDRPGAPPALQLCRIALRPRGPLESLDLALRAAREWWRPLAKLSAIVLVPCWIACTALLLATGNNPWALLAPIALSPLVQAPFTVLGGRLLFAETVQIREVFAELWTRRGPWGGALVIQAVGVLLCAPLLPIVTIPLVFVSECALLERVPFRRAFRRSSRLTGGYAGGAVVGVIGRWVLLAWAAVVAEASVLAVSQILQVASPLPGALDGRGTPWMVAGILLSHPAWALWRLLLYVDVRTRVEGWDLQVGLRAAGLAR